MKKYLLSMLFLAFLAASCDNGEENQPEPEPTPVPGVTTADLGDGSTKFVLAENTTLSADITYTLRGFVYVPDGKTLTIEPGTVIKGEKSSKATLIIERGGRIIAEGTKDRPIVFTSSSAPGARKPGDWGGIIILGKAPNNKGEMTIEGGVSSNHGGGDAADNSGVLKYLRIEFAGIEHSIDNEINGLTLGSVGTGTVIDYVQVSHSGDDAFEWFGGTVNVKHLVAYGTWDDDFDCDNGFCGNVQFALSSRDPYTADKSASNGFEVDNNADASADAPFTTATFANVSLWGPVDPTAVPSTSNWVDRGGQQGSTVDARFQAALHLRRNSSLSIYNSVFAMWPIGVIIENDKGSATQSHYTNGEAVLKGNVMTGMVRDYQDAQYWSGGTVFNPANGSDAFVASYFPTANTVQPYAKNLVDALKLSGNPRQNPVVFPAGESVLATGADWADAKVASGFDKVAYRGAFGPAETASSNWAAGWTNFDAQNTVY